MLVLRDVVAVVGDTDGDVRLLVLGVCCVAGDVFMSPVRHLSPGCHLDIVQRRDSTVLEMQVAVQNLRSIEKKLRPIRTSVSHPIYSVTVFG